MNAPLHMLLAWLSTLLCLAAEKPQIQTIELKGTKAEQFIIERTHTEISEIAKGKCISIAIKNSSEQARMIENVQLFLVRPSNKSDVDVDVFEWTQGSRSDGDVNVLFNITDQEMKLSYLVFREKKLDDSKLNFSIEVRTTIRLESLAKSSIASKKH